MSMGITRKVVASPDRARRVAVHAWVRNSSGEIRPVSGHFGTQREAAAVAAKLNALDHVGHVVCETLV